MVREGNHYLPAVGAGRKPNSSDVPVWEAEQVARQVIGSTSMIVIVAASDCETNQILERLATESARVRQYGPWQRRNVTAVPLLGASFPQDKGGLGR